MTSPSNDSNENRIIDADMNAFIGRWTPRLGSLTERNCDSGFIIQLMQALRLSNVIGHDVVFQYPVS